MTSSLPRPTWSRIRPRKHLLTRAVCCPSVSRRQLVLHCAMVLTYIPASSCSSTSMAARCYRRRPALRFPSLFSMKPFARWATLLTSNDCDVYCRFKLSFKPIIRTAVCLLAVPTVSMVIGSRGSSYAALSICNEIIREIRNSPLVASFKKHLKTQYLYCAPPHMFLLVAACTSDLALCVHYQCRYCSTSSSAVAEGPRNALSQLKSCQLLHNCTKSHIW